jgi:hypothetical protein
MAVFAGSVTVAERIAAPVVELATDCVINGVVRGIGRSAAYLDFDGFVVAVAGHGAPLMPNGVVLSGPFGAWRCPGRGSAVSLERGRIAAGPGSVVWADDLSTVWDPHLSAPRSLGPEALGDLGTAILAACGIDLIAPDPELLALGMLARGVGRERSIGLRAGGGAYNLDGIESLLRSVTSREPNDALAAACWLIGRGPGLTPEGDDLIAAAAGVIAVFGAGAGWATRDRLRWLVSVVGTDLRVRTTPLSATLLELAATGMVVEPLHDLLRFPVAGTDRWHAALRRLLGVGRSTGLAYATGAGAALLLCASTANRTKEPDARY